MSLTCGNCGNPVEASETLCMICGDSLSGLVEPPVTVAPEQGQARDRLENRDSPPLEGAGDSVESAPVEDLVPPVSAEPESEPEREGVHEDPDPKRQAWSREPESFRPEIVAENISRFGSADRDKYGDFRIPETDLPRIFQETKKLMRQGFRMFGLFGGPGSGKSSLIYALMHHFSNGTDGFGGYSVDGPGWQLLAEDLEIQYEDGKPTGHGRGLYPYRAMGGPGKKGIALLDIAGEHFGSIKDWSDEIFQFFGAFFSRCKGFFVLMEIDEFTLGHHKESDAAKRKSRQLHQIVNFLKVAATLKKVKNQSHLQRQKMEVDRVLRKAGRARIRVPVVLGLTKADLMARLHFGDRYQRILPGTDSVMGDPWRAVAAIWPEHYRSLLELVPHLKIEWLSCLGPDFEESHKFSGSLGLRGAFDYLVVNPPSRWAMSTKSYLKVMSLDRWRRARFPWLGKARDDERFVHFP